MRDIDIVCAECGAAFVFTAAEQAFFEAQGLASAPKRCRGCRQARRRAGAEERRARGGFEITCSACGKQATVPFEPEAGRDVYCQVCYRARRSTLRPEADPIAEGGSDSGIVE